MKAAVQKWGNSLALRIPSAFARQIRVTQGDAVELTVEKGALVMRPARPSYRVADLINGIHPDNCRTEVDWGKPMGKEA